MSWYLNSGPESDVVISSRIRLARNIKNIPFPSRINKEQAAEVIKEVKKAIFENDAFKNDFLFLNMDDITSIEKQAMVERHLISPELAAGNNECGVIVSRDEKISIMVNEEDHLRIQCLYPGMQIDAAWELCDKIDSILSRNIDIAFDVNYGYLTCCPTNLGTGMRASLLLHLPALAMTGHIGKILSLCGKLGISVRGFYGEHSQAIGNMFQISNQVTLGNSESDIRINVKNIGKQIIDSERSLRNEMYSQNSYRFEDRIYRSLGILSSSRIMTTEESLKRLSDVRLGVDMGIIKDIDKKVLNEILIFIQPANLQKLFGKPMSADERDIIRAEVIRNKLAKT
jgi:protein arginine kinase